MVEIKFNEKGIKKMENKLFNKIRNKNNINDLFYLKFDDKEINNIYNFRLNEFSYNIKIMEILNNKIKSFNLLMKINENYKDYYFNDLNQLFNFIKNFDDKEFNKFLNI